MMLRYRRRSRQEEREYAAAWWAVHCRVCGCYGEELRPYHGKLRERLSR
jgi:hypothetical protein